jgi:hypothetical protein
MMHFYTVLGAALTATALSSTAASATGNAGSAGLTKVATTTYTDQSFSSIFERITLSFGGLPGLISMFAYLIGIIFAIAGILKIKDHVEDPSKTDLKSGAIRLVVGGALFALPFVMATMTATIGDQNTAVTAPTLNKAGFGVAK